MRRVAAAIAIALTMPACASTPEAAPERSHPSLTGQQAICAESGEREPLAVAGDVQVVELWATWCAPCVKALPLWSALATKERLQILAVSIDDERMAPVEFARVHGIELPILWDPFGREISAAVPLGGVVPTTLVVDCEGRVRHVHEGFNGPGDVEEIAAEVRVLRKESSCSGAQPLARCAP